MLLSWTFHCSVVVNFLAEQRANGARLLDPKGVMPEEMNDDVAC